MLGMREECEEARDAQLEIIRAIAENGKRRVSSAWVMAMVLDALERQGWTFSEELADAVAAEDLELVAKLLPERKSDVA